MKKYFAIFLSILTVAGILLAVVPPLVPLTSLQLKVERQLNDILGRSVHMGSLRFQVFPLPAFVVEDLVVDGPAAGIQSLLFSSDGVEAGLDILALFHGLIAVNKLAFRGPQLSGSLGDSYLLLGLSRLSGGAAGSSTTVAPPLKIPGSVMDNVTRQLPYFLPDSRFSVTVFDGSCRLENVPDLLGGLHLRNIEAVYSYDSSHSGSTFHGDGACLGGRFGADLYWHLPEDGAEPPSASLQIDGKIQLVGLLLKNIRLQLPASANFLGIPYGSGNLELEVNGYPDKGVTFGCQGSLNDLIVERQSAAGAGKQRLVQNLSIDLVASGYLATRDDYINLKSVRLNLPGETTVFSKGLIKYGDHLVLDLLNDVKVPKIEALTARLPALSGVVSVLTGDCSGQVNIIGNLEANPVLRLNLSSRQLSFMPPGMAAGIASGGGTDSRKASCSPLKTLEGLLAWSMDSDWLADIHCRVEKLDLCPASFSEVELAGKKMMNQLVVEKLAGNIAGGNLRISLVVDDLLHDPFWNGSLVVKKVNLEKALSAWPLTGELDGSLVLGGEAPTVDGASPGWLGSMRGSGMVTVVKGAFKLDKLTDSLFGFSRLIGLRTADFLKPFSRLQIPVKISGGNCRMKKIKLSAPWYLFQGGATMDFAGRVSLQGILSHADPAGPFTPGRPFPYRRRLKANGSFDRLTWQ